MNTFSSYINDKKVRILSGMTSNDVITENEDEWSHRWPLMEKQKILKDMELAERIVRTKKSKFLKIRKSFIVIGKITLKDSDN